MNGSLVVVPLRRAVLLLGLVLAALAAFVAPSDALAQDERSVLLFTGTTGFRHTDAINNGRPIVQTALEQAGYDVTWEDCNGNGGGANNCDNPDKNPRIFSNANLAQYDAILLLNASSGPPGPLWNEAQRGAIINYVQNGGGIAGVHNSTDMGTGAATWDWWDGGPNSVVGTTMKGHGATNLGNVAQVQVQDKNHLATRDLPDQYGFGDEHYNFARNVRGDHHVLATLDERTYTPGNPMGQDHPISWCKLYDGDNIDDGTSTPKNYFDGRTWVTAMGHFGASYTENGGDNNLVKQIVGGVRWVAGEGRKSDCSGTVWTSFTRTVLVPDANNPIGIDIAKDGKVYWSEIGTVGNEAEGYIKMHDPSGAAGNKTTVATIPTRADHGNSEDGVLGMSLEPGFDLADPQKRDVFVYYSPRPGAGDNWPTSGNAQTVGYNLISRFTLNAAGTAVEPNSERVILRVPKAKISGSPSGFPGGPTDSGPGHVGGAGLDFDSEGNLYLGVGDDVSPNASGHNGYPPMDYRASERWDARKTSANTNDLRGKVLRIKPLDDIAAGTNPGLNETYSVPAGNMFAVGTANTRPEIYAMGFRQPFTVHTDPANPGTAVVGEYCHDNSSNGAQRAPAGVCEWNLVKEPGFYGWPFCMGNNSADNTSWRWNYANQSTTGQQYDCSQSSLPSDINWAPDGQTAAAPTFPGLENIPGPAKPATIWKKYPGAAGGQSTADFGDLSAGGMQPITGPVYRYDEETAGAGAFPPYYDGSWFINNRGTDNGFWKEVRLRQDNNNMLHVHDWLPYNAAGSANSSFNSLVIGTQFGPDGALYMARFPVGCCRNGTNPSSQTQIVKISFNVQDQCETDTQAPNASHEVTGQRFPDQPNTFVNSASLRLTANDIGCAGVDTIEYRRAGTTEWTPYSGPVAFDEGGEYTIEYRATDRMDNVSTVRTATFTVVEIQDNTAPTVTAQLDGSQDQRDYYIGAATLRLAADDGPTGSGVDTVEYRINGGNWQEYTAPVVIDDPAAYTVDYRATDNVANTSQVQTLTFRLLSGAGCTPSRTDEFTGSTIGSQWLRHTRNGGTPTTGAMAPRLDGGQLIMPTNDFELDGSGASATGPVNFLGQDLAALGDAWEVETQFTIQHNGGWQFAGLMVWNGDNSLFRSTITHNLGNSGLFVEQSKDNPTSAEGDRQQSGSTTILPDDSQPVTIRMRYARAAGSDTVAAQYRIMAPASVANPDWVDFPGGGFLDLNPAGGPRRDAAGSRIGLLAAGNFPGSTGTDPYTGTPAEMKVDYFRVTPDVVNCEEVAPTTTAALDPAQPGVGGTYTGPVEVNLSATDGTGAGVDATEYRVNGGEWQRAENTEGASPFLSSVTLADSGDYTVEFRSIDAAANQEATKSISFSIDLPDCLRSDEFDGDGLDARWLRHTRNGGTPTTGPMAPRLAGGQLILPTNDFELDAASATTSVGPVNFIGQDLAALGDSWEVETQFTIQHNGGWQHTGLMVWNGDNNLFRSTITHSLSGGNIYIEQSKDNPTTAEGARVTAGGNRTVLPNDSQPVTIRMRYARAAGSNSVTAQYRIMAPASVADPDWVNFAATSATWNNSGGLDLNPAGGPRRDAAGSRIGLIAAGNFPGSTGNDPYTGTPAEMKVDYFRVTPDDCPDDDTQAPTTTHELDPATPGAGGTYDGPVDVTLSATDEAEADPFGLMDSMSFAAAAAATHDVSASGNVWLPAALDAVVGDVVTWRFDRPDNSQPHDVWLVPPGGNPDPAGPDIFQVTSGIVFPGPTTASHTLDEAGNWTYICRLHSSFSGGAWSGMVGTAAVTEGPGGGGEASGVDFTEYRVITDGEAGEWVRSNNADDEDPFETAFTVSDEGEHTVEYRSVDNAGNEEAVKSVAFDIEEPEPGTPIVRGFADPSSGAAPLHVRFSATAIDPDGGAVSYRWVVEGVGTVLGDSFEHTFTQAGEYTATVTATDNEGDTASDVVTVTVGGAANRPPVVDATVQGATSGPAPFDVQFRSVATDPDGPEDALTYTWDFDDEGASFEQDPKHRYLEPGTYTATVTVEDAGGATGTDTVQITVTNPPGNVAPVVEVGALPESGPAPLEVLFTADGSDPDGDSLTYQWAFGDGSGPASGRSVRHTYTTPGTYTATVTASDGNGGTDTAEVEIVVGNPPGNQPPTVQAAADPASGTAPLSVRFSSAARDPDGDPLLYEWTFGDGGAAGGAAATHEYGAAGTYTATIKVTDPDGETATDTVQVVVAAAPAARQQQDSGGDAAPPAPDTDTWFSVNRPGKTTVARFARRGVRVQVTCTDAMTGTASVKVSRSTARKMGLKGRTLASRSVQCAGAGSRSVTLKPSRAAKRALARARGAVKATLQVSMSAAGEDAKQETRRLTLSK